MEDVNGQLQTKYQKIATEYSKVRAQVNVLKKAVIDEQTRNADYREQLKEKEVGLRRAEQELDSLTFRNQQLTKRVTVLQEELDQIQNRGKKGRSKSSDSKTQPTSPPNHILDEEFQKKIVENAQLLSQIGDKDSEIEALNQRIEQLEYELNLSKKSKVELERKNQDTIERLEREKSDLQRKLNERQKQEEITSWSSSESKRDGTDYDSKTGIFNHHQADLSPSTSSSPSCRSSKSLGEIKSRKKSISREESNDEFEITKLLDLEKELNHWKAQYNIIKIKYDEFQEKVNTETVQIEKDSMEPVQITNMVGRLSAPFVIPEEIEAREMKIKDYFIREIDKLTTEKHIYHVKNLAIAANTEVMNAHLDMSESKRDKCEAALLEALSNWTSLQEDKEVQGGNYKAQLSTMSEHLANMNEKLIQQTEEIQQLKFELANKNDKKGKQK